MALNEIIITVAAVFNQPIPTVQKYKRDCNDARDCAMLIAKKHYGYRLKEISDQVDIKCYQTVSSACFRFESKINQKQTLLDNYTVVLRLLNRSAKKPNE